MGHNKLVLTAIAVVIGLALSTGNAMAAKGMFSLGPGDMANGHMIYTQGKGNAAPCFTCHAEDGSGIEAMGAPRLSGQFFTFLYKQLEDFATNKRVPQGAGAVMNAFAAALSEQDRIDVATYLANKIPSNPVLFDESYLEELEAQGIEVGRPYRGRQLVEFGSPVRTDGYPRDLGSQGPGLPACKSCHGVAGRGAPPVYPMIGQQRYTYLVAQLKQWRDGSRANDKMGQMQAVAQRMSDQDIRDAAAYLSVADPYFATGSNRTPYDFRVKVAEERMRSIGR
jgi:cytochrome c553